MSTPDPVKRRASHRDDQRGLAAFVIGLLAAAVAAGAEVTSPHPVIIGFLAGIATWLLVGLL